jgi:hypothetical protein
VDCSEGGQLMARYRRLLGVLFRRSRPVCYVEYRTIDPWMEHLPQHGRMAQADHDLLQFDRSFLIGEKPKSYDLMAEKNG